MTRRTELLYGYAVWSTWGSAARAVSVPKSIDEFRAVLFPGDRQDLLLQSCRQKKPGLSTQCFDLGLHQWDLALVLGAQQHTKDARDPQPGALGRATSVPLVQQDHIRGQFQRQRDGLGLTGVESGREQPRDLVLPKRPRFDPTVLESLLDLLSALLGERGDRVQTGQRRESKSRGIGFGED